MSTFEIITFVYQVAIIIILTTSTTTSSTTRTITYTICTSTHSARAHTRPNTAPLHLRPMHLMLECGVDRRTLQTLEAAVYRHTVVFFSLAVAEDDAAVDRPGAGGRPVGGDAVARAGAFLDALRLGPVVCVVCNDDTFE